MNCKIVGYDFKSLEVLLEQGDAFFCERGAIVYHEDGIEKNVKNVDIDFSLNLSSLISNSTLILQKISGAGTVFLDSVGSSVFIDVKAGTSVYVDEKHFLCINAGAINQLNSTFSGRGFLAGEGLSMYQISGPAKVYVTTQN